MLANVIFPAFTAPYFSWLFFPTAAFAALSLEIAVFKFRHPELTWPKSMETALIANLASWIVGVVLGFVLPSGLVAKAVPAGERQISILTQGPHFNALMLLSFGVAFVLSIAIEYRFWRRVLTQASGKGALATTILAHVASYAALLSIAWLQMQYQWW